MRIKNLKAAEAFAKFTYQNGEAIAARFSEIAKAKEGVTDEQRRDWLRANANNREALAAAVIQNVNSDVLAHTFALGFFQQNTLQPTEWPVIESDNRDKNYSCVTIGEDGSSPQKMRVPRQSHAEYLIRQLVTPEVFYPLMSLQTGNVSQAEKVQQEIAYELRLKLDQLALAVLDAGVKASGLRSTLNLHPSVVTANIPTKNYYDLSAADSGTLTLAKLKDVLDYFERFSSDVELDGAPLEIKTIYMSSQQKRDIWDFVSLVAGYNLSGAVQDPKNTVTPDMRQGIFTSGKINSLFGYPVSIVTRNTLAKGTMYISSNKPAALLWTKPAFDKLVINDSPDLLKQNKNSMFMQMAYAMALPSEWTYRFMKVKL